MLSDFFATPGRFQIDVSIEQDKIDTNMIFYCFLCKSEPNQLLETRVLFSFPRGGAKMFVRNEKSGEHEK